MPLVLSSPMAANEKKTWSTLHKNDLSFEVTVRYVLSTTRGNIASVEHKLRLLEK